MILVFKRFALYFLSEWLIKIYDTLEWDLSYTKRIYEGANVISAWFIREYFHVIVSFFHF